jgi:hypothetical protein
LALRSLAAIPNSIVGLDIAVLVLIVLARRAFWNVEVVQDMESLEDSFDAGLCWRDRLAVCDGVKSPGIPSIPEPWPNGSGLTRSSLTGATLAIEKSTQLRRFFMCQSKTGEFVIDIELAADILGLADCVGGGDWVVLNDDLPRVAGA